MNYPRLALTVGLPAAVGVGVARSWDSVGYGILIGLATMVVIITIVAKLRPSPAWTKPGTRAWEAKLTMDVLVKTIAHRVEETKTVPVAQLPKKIREIEFLTGQVDTLASIVERNDASPGRGYVGFEPYAGD
ncbi:hypothetical protein BH11MYX1_BH11MYX1_44770 [soil metagenome]